MNTMTALQASTERVRWLGTEYVISLPSTASGGLIGAFEGTVPPGEGPPLHVHHGEDEVIHVIDGAMEFWLDGTVSHRGPGESVFLPRDVPHTFRVVSTTPSRSLAIVTPGGFEAFFPAVARAGLSPADGGMLQDLASRFALEFLGPPPWTQ